MATKQLNVNLAVELELVERNDKRTFLMIQNGHATQNLYISDEEGKLSEGLILWPKQSPLIISRENGGKPEKQWWVTANGNNTQCYVIEQFETELEKPYEPPLRDVQEPGIVKDPPM